MSAPHQIVALTESVVGILFSDVRHRERAAFILADELVEICCKVRAMEHNNTFNTKCGFHDAVEAPGVSITDGLLSRLKQYHSDRNLMQHRNAAATVDQEYCSTFVVDAVSLIEELWPGSEADAFKPWLQSALRVVRLYSNTGRPGDRIEFEDRMRDHAWNPLDDHLAANEITIKPGRREFWSYCLVYHQFIVDEILDELQAKDAVREESAQSPQDDQKPTEANQ